MLLHKRSQYFMVTVFLMLCITGSTIADEEALENDVESINPLPIEQQEVKPVELKNKENGIIVPTNPEWLKGINLSGVSTKVRSVESGLCAAPKCDGSDNDDCYKNCGCNPIESDVFGCTVKNSWALTFDDGPSNSTLELLDHLKKINVKATFCVIGSYVKQYPQVLKRIYDEGHQIASHTYSHAHLMSLTNEEIIYELKATEEAVREVTGVVPKYLRPPFGEADARVKSLLKEMGYKLLMWNVDPHDYNHQMKENGGELIQKGFEEIVMGTGGVNNLNVHSDPGYVSLQHDLYERSIRQVPNVVKLIQDKGFKLMTVSECIGDSQAHSSPKSPVSSKVSDSKQNSDTSPKSQPNEKKQSSSNKVLATTTVSIVFAAISLAHYLL